eukprot:297986_1
MGNKTSQQPANSKEINSLKTYQQLLSMGFDDKLSFQACKKFGGNVDRSIEYIVDIQNNNILNRDETKISDKQAIDSTSLSTKKTSLSTKTTSHSTKTISHNIQNKDDNDNTSSHVQPAEKKACDKQTTNTTSSIDNDDNKIVNPNISSELNTQLFIFEDNCHRFNRIKNCNKLKRIKKLLIIYNIMNF